jgi:amino acid adenylation domain-containing protein
MHSDTLAAAPERPAGAGRAAAYWLSRLDGLDGTSGFPIDLAVEDGAGQQVAERAVELPTELVQRLRRISRGQPEALHVLLMAGLVGLLRRYTRTDDVAVGQPCLGGAVRQLLVVRAAGGRTLRELLMSLRDTVRDAVSHQDFPLDTLAIELGRPPADCTEVAISLVGLHDDAGAQPSVRIQLRAEDHEAGITLAVRYDASRYTARSAERIAGQLATLLDAATADPDRELAGIELCTADDARIIAASNATDRPLEPDATIAGLFARRAAADPDAPALLTDQATVSFGELDARSTALAHTLRERGIGRDTPVGILADRSVELLVAVLAVLKAGGAYLPLDPAYPAARIDYLLSDSGAPLVLARPEYRTLAGRLPVLDLDEPANYPSGKGEIADPPTPSDLAYVIYTSGSTGEPKGVAVEHRAVVNRLAWMQRAYPIGPGDVLIQKTSISFDVSVWELFWWTFTGAALALLEPGGEKDPAAIVAAVERHAASTVHFVPSMLAPFLDHVERYGEASRLTGLRRVFTSGEALPPRLGRRLAELLPQAELVNLYGPTEATVDVTHQPVHAADPRARLPIGRPIDNLRGYVLEPSGHRAPVGLPGELCLAGTGLARGYLGRPELTTERFGPVAGIAEDRLYRTGDLVRWLDDGSLDYLGRIDRQLKVRGYRVEPGEIEECLRSHPAVRDAAVVDRHDGWQTSLRGFVVAAEPVTEAELKRHLRQRLPEYLVPSRIAQLDALPLTPNGKLDRAALRRPRKSSGPAHVPPRTDREAAMAGIWAEVLGLPRVGVFDDFFALGGNSIHFVEVLAKARTIGLGFTFQQLFEHHTIAGLAGHAAPVDPEAPAGWADQPFALLDEADKAALPADAVDGYPLSLLQAGLIFQTELTGALGQYHDVLSYLVGGRFDEPAFTEAVRILVGRHPILRTSYRLTGYTDFLQVVHEQVPLPLQVVDLRGRSADDQQAWHEEWLAAEKRRRFGWAEGGLVSLHVQILADDRYRYTVSQHNSALDGWSISLLHTQLFEIYNKLRNGQPVPPVTTDHHLHTFVALEREAISSSAARDFWLEMLRDSSSTRVPRSRPEVARNDFRVILHDVDLPAGLTERVVALADELSVPVKDVLLAAHVKVLGELAGESTVLTGYEHSGRPELPGAETALGLYLNTVPLRIDLGRDSWAELIRRVYRAELDLLPHRRYPMARMKQDLGTQRELFETTFNYTHFYLLKRLKELPEFALLDLRVDSETEFPFRTEFSRHFFDDDLRLCLHYHEHLFTPEHIDRIGGCFVEVLERMTAEPSAGHAARPLLAEPDRGVLAVPAGSPVVPAESAAPMEPSGPAENDAELAGRIAAIWAGVLDLGPDELDGDSDFFALGGNSLSALRVSLETDGLVTLTDLMRHPRLADVVRLAARRRRGTPDVLQLLSSSTAGTRCVLICVPYPSGHPINFAPLAAELEELSSDLAVYGLLPPGHDFGHPDEFIGVTATARLAADELADSTEGDLPVLIWGHCGGAAVAIELARQLEVAGREVRRVFIGSKLLPSVEEMARNARAIAEFADDKILRHMIDETGYTDLDGLDEAHSAFVAAVFRHDVGTGYQYLIDAVQCRLWQLAAPLTFVVAADDRTLAGYPAEYQRWSLLAPDVQLAVLESGGHYFVRTVPAAVAELVVAAWEDSVDGVMR